MSNKIETLTFGFNFKELRPVFKVDREDAEWEDLPESIVALEISWWASQRRSEYFRTFEFSFGDWPGWIGIRFRIYRLEVGFGKWKV